MWYYSGSVVKNVSRGYVEVFNVVNHELTSIGKHTLQEGELEGFSKLPKVWSDWFDEVSITNRGLRTIRYI